MVKIVFLRHGESIYNKENRFTGWTDVDLSEKGIEEARSAGQRLKAAGFVFDIAHTSSLKRASRTMWLALEELGQKDIPVETSWRLNERHYGALQGLSKSETAAKYGEEKVFAWRRSYDTPPPRLKKTDPRYPGRDPKYSELKEDEIPLGESLADTVKRVLPYWDQVIVPELKKGKRLFVVAHGNSLRAIVMHLDRLSGVEVAGLDIPTGIPLVYEFDKGMSPKKHEYLAPEEELKAKLDAVKSQGKAQR